LQIIHLPNEADTAMWAEKSDQDFKGKLHHPSAEKGPVMFTGYASL